MLLVRDHISEGQSTPATAFDWEMLTWGFAGGLMVVLLTITAALGIAVFKRVREQSKHTSSPTGTGKWVLAGVTASRDTRLPAGATWSFSDSWATNLTALITTTAALAAIFLEDLQGLFDGQAPLAYSLTTSVMLVIAALAPVVYTVFQRELPQIDAQTPVDDKASETELPGTMLGWCLSAAVTAFAVGGSLAAAMRFSLQVKVPAGRDGHELVVCAAIGLVIVLVMAYVIRSFFVLLRAVRSKAHLSVGSLTGLVRVSCCSGTDGAPRMRISLL